MFSFATLEVAFGLVFLYLILSLVSSAVNETISSVFSWRAKFLRRGIANLLDPENHANGLVVAEQLFAHPLVNGMIRPFPPGGRTRYPSYLPSRTFASALLDLDASGAGPTVEEAVAKIPSERARTALGSLLQETAGDAARFRRSVEEWYDDAMERVSGWYRRRLQLLTWGVAAVLVVVLNADTIRIAQHLWTDNTVRSAVVAQAERAAEGEDFEGVAARVRGLDELAIPIGWGAEARPDGARDWLVTALAKALGLLLTAAALTLGAPFWFDLLSKIARIRSAGAPPPAARATRHGEGEQEREGPPG
jgi:hypothetical protein